MAELLLGAAWRQPPLSMRGQRGDVDLCGQGCTAPAPASCPAPGSLLAKVALLHPEEVMGNTQPSRRNGPAHGERLEELKLPGLGSHSAGRRGDDGVVRTAWGVQGPGREQGHRARLGEMPRNGKTGYLKEG